MVHFYSLAVFLASSGVALAWDVTPTPTAVPGPVAGLGLPAFGLYLGYRYYRNRKARS